MARAHFRHVAHDQAGNVVRSAAVYLFAPDTAEVDDTPTGTAITGSMFALRTGGSAIANPLISNDLGIVEAWLDTPQTLDVVVTRNGGEAHYPGNSQYKVLFEPRREYGHAYHDPADVGGGGGAHPDLATHDALGLATQSELGAVIADLIAHAAASGAHHAALHAALHAAGQSDQLLLQNLGGAVTDGQIPGTIARTSQLHTQLHSIIDAAHHNGFPGGTTTFLRADGTFAAPPGGGGGGAHDHTGAEGQVVTGGIADDAVTYAKIQNVSATARLLGRNAAGAGNIEELTAAVVRAMLGVGPVCEVYRSTAQSIPNSTGTVVNFDAEQHDSDTFHDTVTNNTRITIPAGMGGHYLVYGQLAMAANATGSRYADLLLNGGLACSVGGPDPEAADYRQFFLCVRNLAAGDYVELSIFHTAGASLNTLSGVAGIMLGVMKL